MFRRVLMGSVVLFTAVFGLPGLARAAQAPPALGGEVLSASPMTDGSTVPFALPCTGGDSPDFNFSGTSTGPYAGSFIESGTVIYSAPPCWPPASAGEPCSR